MELCDTIHMHDTMHIPPNVPQMYTIDTQIGSSFFGGGGGEWNVTNMY